MARMKPLSIIDFPSPNHDARSAGIDLVVLHYTGMQNAQVALSRLTDPIPVAGKYPGPWQAPDIDPKASLGRVSAHYVVREDGQVFRLVDEALRAWHAGASVWEGRTDTNDRSVGIEIVNGGHDFGLPDFPEAQIEAVIALAQDILTRRKLGPARVVGHSDVAPGRKLDPGERFPWRALFDAGIGLAPRRPARRMGDEPPAKENDSQAIGDLQRDLAAIGYSLDATGLCDDRTVDCVRAFQARYRQAGANGVADEETRIMVADLAEQVRALGSP